MTLKLWDAAEGKVRHTLSGHEDALFAVAVSADGEWIFSGGTDKTLKAWDAETGDLVDTIRVDAVPTCISARGPQIWVGCLNSTVCTYDHRPTAR